MQSQEAVQLKLGDIVERDGMMGKIITIGKHMATILWLDGRAVQYDFKEMGRIVKVENK